MPHNGYKLYTCAVLFNDCTRILVHTAWYPYMCTTAVLSTVPMDMCTTAVLSMVQLYGRVHRDCYTSTMRATLVRDLVTRDNQSESGAAIHSLADVSQTLCANHQFTSCVFMTFLIGPSKRLVWWKVRNDVRRSMIVLLVQLYHDRVYRSSSFFSTNMRQHATSTVDSEDDI